jgi:hypothetical protein
MTRAALTAEEAVCSAYREQAECYREASALADSLPGLIRAGEEHGERLGRIMALMAQVAAIEERIRGAKAQWIGAGGRLGADLRAVLTEVTQLMERLARRLAAAEQEATERQARLVPEVDALIRGRAMRRAHGRA